MKNLKFGQNYIPCDTDEDEKDKAPKEFHEMSRDERLEQLTNINEDSSKDWVGLKSLTGANASGWKFEDPYYGKFNVGKRPSMDTAWGRRVYDQVIYNSRRFKNFKNHTFFT